jgi:hypothetical protein
MKPGPLIQQVIELKRKREFITERLIPLARGAANQMKDAGMHRGADPLLAVLFEIDAVEEELKTTWSNEQFADQLIDSLKNSL